MTATQAVQATDPQAVLTKATLRAAELLTLQSTDLAKVIGVSDATVSRYRNGGAEISPTTKAGELALLLVRIFRSLDPLVGSDTDMRRQWMHSRNKALGGVPAELVLKPDGLVRTLAYLDGMRAPRMTQAQWQPEWLADTAIPLAEPAAWRGVETQYASASLQLVDSHAEHDALEALLEASKPPLPSPAQGRHFLLFTPFRYMPMHPSRFRALGHLGIWYGARELKAACAEVAYWRMRFILDSAGLTRCRITTRHTFFIARIEGSCIDLTSPPWSAFESAWKNTSDHAQTQRLAGAAEAAGIQVLQYVSVRAPWCTCFAVFTPEALSEPAGGLDRSRQRWTCTATHDRVLMAEDGGPGRFEWDH